MLKKKENLKDKSEKEIYELIKSELAIDTTVINSLRYTNIEEFKKEHLRFDMSGIDKRGYSCTAHNQYVLNKFAYLGIYDNMDYLNLCFRKGGIVLFYKRNKEKPNQEDITGEGTCSIIYRILEITNVI